MISICFIVLLLISILTSSYGQVTCASGWVQNGGKCYLLKPVFNNGGREGTWDQCNAYCTTASYPGAMMLCVRNAAENAFVTSVAENVPQASIWIGYTDMPPYGGGYQTKRYGWVTGCSSTYTNWYRNQPDSLYNREDYAILVSGGFNGQWNDDAGFYNAYCGCEYNPALTTTPSYRPSTIPSSRSSVNPSSGAVTE